MSPSASCHRHVVHSRRTALSFFVVIALFLLLSSFPCAVLSQNVQVQPSPAYFADQPVVSLTSTNASIATFPLTFNYSSVIPLLFTNATAVTVSMTGTPTSTSPLSVTQLASINAAGSRGYLLTSASLSSSCQYADVSQQGRCSILVSLTSSQPEQVVVYSLYTLNSLQYNNIYTDTVTPHTWRYYIHYIQSADTPVTFTLQSPTTNQPLTTLMIVAASQQLFQPGCPQSVNGTDSVVIVQGQEGCLLPYGTGVVPDYFVMGLYGFGGVGGVSELQVMSGVSSSNDDSAFGGYAILSLLSLVLAAGFIGLVIVRGCCVYRRWNTYGGGRHVTYTVDAPPMVYDPAVFHFQQTTAGQAGVLRTDHRSGVNGATEAEIAELPMKVYTRSSSEDGEESDGDPRCTICLDDYEPNVSRITTLRCGHQFHSQCAAAWLRQRRHCPLCLQLIDQATDVKQRRNSTAAPTSPPAIELATIRPTIALPAAAQRSISAASHEPASRTVVLDEESGSVVHHEMGRYSSAAQEGDDDMQCAIEIATPQHLGRPPL